MDEKLRVGDQEAVVMRGGDLTRRFAKVSSKKGQSDAAKWGFW